MNTRRITTILVDDEFAAIASLEQLLAKYPEIAVINTSTNPKSSLDYIIQNQPDVVFLDVQMPEMSGFEVIEALDREGVHPVIIFVTAYDHYAIEAIHHAAFDYLLKPVDEKELARVINRLLQDATKKDNVNMFRSLLGKINPVKRIKLSTTGGFILLNTSDIIYIEADWNYSDIYLADGSKQLVTTNVGSLEKILPVQDFHKINRSIIINLNYLAKVNRLKRLAILETAGKEFKFKIPLLNIRKLENRLENNL